ncbi:hypothetical protein HanRHA438_Chr08g0335731 [Helianthus annuus]|nr:hypothetical protein HanRHA438_Chr08g0335731 [Helianthus annuus]
MSSAPYINLCSVCANSTFDTSKMSELPSTSMLNALPTPLNPNTQIFSITQPLSSANLLSCTSDHTFTISLDVDALNST